jgi:hypothetical protein
VLNMSIPRIVKQYEEAFVAHGLKFQKARPAHEFMLRMGRDPASVLPAGSATKFETLFKGMRERYGRMKAAGRGSFA